jgi:hypothetical protein
MLFLVVLHYKMRGRAAQARPPPEPDTKIKPRRVSGMVMGRIFLARNNINFFGLA